MSEEAQRQYFNPVPPTQSTTPGIGVTWLATTTAAAKLDLNAYPSFFGKMLDLYADGGKIWYAFSSDGVTDISKAATPGATIAAGTLTTAPVPIASGAVATVRLDRIAQRWIHFQADSGTPTLIIAPSSQPRVG